MIAREHRELVWVTSLGGFLEFYDFIIYALMAEYISVHFFPSYDPYSSLLATFATFSAGYLARPLGGLVFGHFGDRYGRKPTFILTVLLMALSTAMIGFLPSYEQIGLWAPVLLTLCRVIQGFSIGGEIPGAMTYLSETVDRREGLVMSLLFLAFVNGLVFGSLIKAGLTWFLPLEDMQEWGWRIPFILGGSLGICSYIIRRRFQESEVFLAMAYRKEQSKVPALTLLQKYRKQLLIGILLITPVAVSMPLLFLFTPGYLTKLLDYSAFDVAVSGGVGVFFSSLIFVAVGLLADKLPAGRVMLFASLLVVFSGWLIFPAYVTGHASLLLMMLFSALVMGGVVGVAPLLLSRLFPVSVRYSGIALSYNISFAVFGGLAPIIAMALIKLNGNLAAPAWYLTISGCLGILAVLLAGRQRGF
ncbi:MFS transporter [Endozoicomonas sp. OPT23]|nr:MFS transporter [Endozoicomonas sp. OPT23]